MYGFCRITDLGISHFNFSSKNYSSKVYTCFGKVVVLSHRAQKIEFAFFNFSVILYRTYKLLLKHNKGEETFCECPPGKFQKITDRPFVCTKLPGTTWGFAMWSKGLEGGAARSNSGDLASELSRGVVGEDLGFTRARLGCLLAAGRWPEGMDGGDRWRRPLE
jgi:hypothetical protein